MHFTLPTDRQLTITNLDFHWTYAGLLIGSPNPSMNREIIERTLKRAREVRPWLPVHLLPPELREPGCLPPICWVIIFISGALPNTDDIWSSLTVVWFAHYNHARPLVEQVQAAVRNIDWDRLAVAWEP